MLPQDSAASLPSAPSSPFGSKPVAHSSYSWKRPNLSEILSNEAQEPWTLAAFTEYCSQNLCLENLNFIMEVKEYERRYGEWEDSGRDAQMGASLITTWKRIVEEFATPGGPQEINLTFNVRHDLSAPHDSDVPAHPSLLVPAFRKIYELMQDSILMSFLNDVRPPSVFEENLDLHDDVHFDDGKSKSRTIQIASGSPTTGSHFSAYHKHSTASTASSGHHPSVSSYRSGRRRSVASAKEPSELTGHASVYSLEAADSGSESGGSPSDVIPTRAGPTSAPRVGDASDRQSSPKPRSDSSGWKKIGAKLGLKKSTSGSKYRKDSGHSHGANSE